MTPTTMTIIIIIFVILVSGCKNNSINNPNDPLFSKQWYLKNINWLPVYQSGITGNGIRVNIAGDSFDTVHPDLNGGVDPRIVGTGHDLSVQSAHGTQMAGLVAAKCNDGIGICGVAPGAELLMNEIPALQAGRVNDLNGLLKTIEYDTGHSDISVNAWGAEDSTGQYQSLEYTQHNIWRKHMAAALQNGRNGKGIVFIWSAGNGTNKFNEIDNSNYDSFANFYGVIPVCSVDKNSHRSVYSERGANLWICAPSSKALQNRAGEMITTSGKESFTSQFGGTSASAAIVGGVVALMLEANKNLTWRDVKIILAKTALKTGEKNTQWQINGGKFQVSHDYGFGVIDALKAVSLAKTWKNISDLKKYKSVVSENDHLLIPENKIQFIEFVEIQTLYNTNRDASDLTLVLISPSGTKSILHEPHQCRKNLKKTNCRLPPRWVYGSAMHLGENPGGKWELIAEAAGKKVNLPKRWSLKVYGYFH